MTATLRVKIDAWGNGKAIPDKHAFCIPAKINHVTLGQNLSPSIQWSDVPKSSASYAIICYDPDVPTVQADVNSETKKIPINQSRMTIYHWILVDIPATRVHLEEGVESNGVQARGKPAGKTDHGIRGLNSYTQWFANDENMKGNYAGYDGPCPPWNDERIHHYHFTVYALDVKSLGLKGNFTGPDVEKAMAGHILAKGEWVGTYTLNPALRSK